VKSNTDNSGCVAKYPDWTVNNFNSSVREISCLAPSPRPLSQWVLSTVFCLQEGAMDSTEFRKFGKAAVDYIADYLENLRDR
jgi:hypothetical protein